MLNRIVVAVALGGLLLQGIGLPVVVARGEEPPPRCFAETEQCIQGRFLEFWQADLKFTTDPEKGIVNPWHGDSGLTRHGYPLTGEIRERLEDGQEYTVQYFERTRLEYHPENAPPNDVLIGALGSRVRQPDPPAAALVPTGDEPREWVPAYFPATGHNLHGFFRVYWTIHGGLTQFGQPISEEFTEQLEDRNVYVVQYFERARFEYHTDIPAPNGVVLGSLGMRVIVGPGR